MRRVLGLAAVLAASLIVAPGASAQDGPPAVGSEVTFVDDEGVAHGAITVQEVADPFTDFDPAYPPQDGTRYVMLTVSFDANTDQSFDTSPYYVKLRDTNGNLINSTTIYRPEGQSLPDLQPQTLAPGNRVSGVIGFVVPEAAEVDDVLYQPGSYRFITLADLMPGAGPLPGTPVAWTATDGSSTTITTNITDPFTEFAPGWVPAEGTRALVLFVVFENTGEQWYRADPSAFYLRDVDGHLLGRGSVGRPPESPLADLEYQPMNPGDRISGVVPFTIPVDTELVEVVYWSESARIATIVDLVAGGAVPVESPAPVESPGAASPAPVESAAASVAP
jgi:hypothetical protein